VQSRNNLVDFYSHLHTKLYWGRKADGTLLAGAGGIRDLMSFNAEALPSPVFLRVLEDESDLTSDCSKGPKAGIVVTAGGKVKD
jgi:hypothetical protein